MSSYPSIKTLRQLGKDVPSSLQNMNDLHISNIAPWHMYMNDDNRYAFDSLSVRNKHPNRLLIPIARNIADDTVACIDLDSDGRISVIHDGAIPGMPDECYYNTFDLWFLDAINELKEIVTFKSGK